MFPTFLIIGSQKAGTTALHEVLDQHPEVLMPGKKELHFFIHDRLYRQGLDRYRRFFGSPTPTTRAVGETTPGYICYPEVPARIHAALPDVKLVLTVRNPIDRAYSQYWYARRHLTEALTFPQAVARHLTRVYHPGEPGYFSRGFYIDYLRTYLRHFRREQLLVLLFDDLVRSPERFYEQLFEFIGVDPSFRCPEMTQRSNPSFIWTNPAYRFFYRFPQLATRLPQAARRLLCSGPRQPLHYPAIDPQTRATLVDVYREPNELLGEFLGRDLSGWNGVGGRLGEEEERSTATPGSERQVGPALTG